MTPAPERAPGHLILALPKGTVAISVNLTDTGRVAGFVTPGTEVATRVDVILASLDAAGHRLLEASAVPVRL